MPRGLNKQSVCKRLEEGKIDVDAIGFYGGLKVCLKVVSFA